MISYSNYSSEEEIQKHLDWFYIYFSILNKKPVKEQAEELKNFCKWITLHGVKIYTCKAGWIKRLIEEIFPLFLDPSVHPEEVEPLLSIAFF